MLIFYKFDKEINLFQFVFMNFFNILSLFYCSCRFFFYYSCRFLLLLVASCRFLMLLVTSWRFLSLISETACNRLIGVISSWLNTKRKYINAMEVGRTVFILTFIVTLTSGTKLFLFERNKNQSWKERL